MKIEYNKTYDFDLTGTVAFGDLPVELVNQLFRDGRVASKFFEHSLPVWFPELTFVDKKGYDHVDDNGNRYDAKSFTKGGLKFCPSVMLGAGRKINPEVLLEHANKTIYICCDIVEFPKARVTFKKGSDLIAKYPNGQIKPKERNVIFG